ncbi:CHAT domain-containing protein [Pectobacterium punjabense]|uniref:CHAT domain-containing protein n=1 Tax=Pectobacterium punjabense TaxID=2108399 RepID=UPI00380DD174
MEQINTFDICYIIKTNNKKTDKTFFFKIDTKKIDSIYILNTISKLPISIHDLFITLEERAESRLKGLTNGYVIKYIHDWNELLDIPYQIKVIFADKKIPSMYSRSAFLIDKNIKNPNIEQIIKNIYKYISKIKKTDKLNEFETININNISFKKDMYSTSTLLALESNNYRFKYHQESSNTDALLHLHTGIINYISKQKNNDDIQYLTKFNFILTDFSIDNYFIENKDKLSKSNLRKIHNSQKIADEIYESINLAKNSLTNINIENIYLKNYISEINYMDTLIGLYACSTFSPTLKSDCYTNDVFTDMNELAKMSRGAKYNEKIGLLTKRVISTLTKKCDNIHPYLKDSAHHPIKIISNLPLEWCLVNKLPLMINTPVSRIPKTPIYLMERLTLELNINTFLNYSSLFNILIIRSFNEDNENDRNLKYILETYINAALKTADDSVKISKQSYSENSNQLFRITIKDVNNLNELVQALNDSEEDIVVFDMHGGHSENSVGRFTINNDNVTISSLISKVSRIPSIVILSSCDTSPIDRNSFNTAAGFLLLGAKSVIASALPINGIESARFISRLLIRIKYYLPERLEKYDGIRWSVFVHGMLKREYFTDLVNHLYKKGLIASVKTKNDINRDIGIILENHFHSDLLDEIFEIICKKTNQEKIVISKEIENNFSYVESIKYLHFGNPENITIVSDDTMNEIYKMM